MKIVLKVSEKLTGHFLMTNGWIQSMPGVFVGLKLFIYQSTFVGENTTVLSLNSEEKLERFTIDKAGERGIKTLLKWSLRRFTMTLSENTVCVNQSFDRLVACFLAIDVAVKYFWLVFTILDDRNFKF